MDVDTLLAVAVDCLLPHHGGASIQSRAYSNSSDEIGIRPDIPVRSSPLCRLLAHAVGAAAASQQERLAICPDST